MLTQLFGDAPARCTCQRSPGLLMLQDSGAPSPALPPSRAARAMLLPAPQVQTLPRRLEGFHLALSLALVPERAPGAGRH